MLTNYLLYARSDMMPRIHWHTLRDKTKISVIYLVKRYRQRTIDECRHLFHFYCSRKCKFLQKANRKVERRERSQECWCQEGQCPALSLMTPRSEPVALQMNTCKSEASSVTRRRFLLASLNR